MSNLKNGAIREMVIDRCLRDHKRQYSTKDLMEACNIALREGGYEEVTSLNTIRSDMRAIELRWFAYGGAIEEMVQGRNKYYSYKDPNFSIYKTELTGDELNKLNQTLLVLKRFQGLPQFEWIDELNARFRSSFMSSPQTESIISFDDNIYVEGRQFIADLFDAIVDKIVLNISYKKFTSNEPKSHILHPYFLKEYSNRWFVLGWDEGHGALATLALDRIENISVENRPFRENKEVDFNEYFEDVIGVTVKQDCPPRKIKLWVSAEQYPYLKTKPLHGSQTVIEKRENGSRIIQIEVQENYELIQTLLSFGEKVILMEPADIKEKIQERIWLAGEKYNRFK